MTQALVQGAEDAEQQGCGQRPGQHGQVVAHIGLHTLWNVGPAHQCTWKHQHRHTQQHGGCGQIQRLAYRAAHVGHPFGAMEFGPHRHQRLHHPHQRHIHTHKDRRTNRQGGQSLTRMPACDDGVGHTKRHGRQLPCQHCGGVACDGLEFGHRLTPRLRVSTHSEGCAFVSCLSPVNAAL